MEIKSTMKTAYLSFFVLFFSVAFSQTQPSSGGQVTQVTPTLFDEKSNPISVYTIEMLGKTSWDNYPNAYTINLMPKNFNWKWDARKIESYKNMYSLPKYDGSGREIPKDVHSDVIQKAYFKSPTYY